MRKREKERTEGEERISLNRTGKSCSTQEKEIDRKGQQVNTKETEGNVGQLRNLRV